MKLSAVIFDLNGTVLTDEKQYGQAFAKVLAQFGIEADSDYPHVAGIGVEENWPIFIKKYWIKTDKSTQELAQETQNEYCKQISQVVLKNGFEKFVENVRENGIQTALATSNYWSVVEMIFEVLDIEKFFDSVTTGEEAEFKKPNPRIFEIAAEKLGVDFSECLVIEDSAAGVEAAHSAGMKVVAFARDDRNKKDLEDADMIVDDFTALSLEKINNL
ncbi:HAD family phosphatase [Patescibacteria group bacterium]|nr:HAD family phosphatase [Patescibacteria group bacterium]